jgi:uncharacterized RDD family membrane protein YckC
MAPPRAAHSPATPSRSAPFPRHALAWLLDAMVLSLLATAITWHWVAPAAIASVDAVRALDTLATAKLVDGMLSAVQPLAMMQSLLHDPAMLHAAARVQDALRALIVPWTLVYAVLAFTWHVAGDLSPWQGSPGKRWLGLRVEALDGGRPAPKQAMLREAGSALSWLTLNLGHALALLPPRRQSLHDRIARTRVVVAGD